MPKRPPPSSLSLSLFNESAGSRKQAYSRLRLTPCKSLSSSSSSSLPRRTPADDDIDPERTENHQIIGLLKLFAPKTNGDDLVPICVEYGESAPEFPSAGRGSVAKGNRYKAHFDFSQRMLLLGIHLPVNNEFTLEIAGESTRN